MRAKRDDGHTLVELLVVAGLLALIAAIAVPSVSTSDDSRRLDDAATQVAAAIRYAQMQAIQRGQPFGVTASSSTNRVRVYRLDETGSSPVPVYDVRNPVTKQLYTIDLDSDGAGPDIAVAYFLFSGSAVPRDFLGFSADTGIPKYNDFGTTRFLEDGYVTLSQDGLTRRIEVSPMTGRVTVQ
jgi:type II secretory pathway pseudopilin PulG